MNLILVQLQRIIPSVNIKGLKTLEEISKLDKYPDWCGWSSSWNWKPATPQFFTYSDYFLDAGQSFQEKVVVDLGAGLHLDNYELARIFRAKAYVRDDKYNARDLFDKFQVQEEYEQKNDFREVLSKLSEKLGRLGRGKNALRLRKNVNLLFWCFAKNSFNNCCRRHVRISKKIAKPICKCSDWKNR